MAIWNQNDSKDKGLQIKKNTIVIFKNKMAGSQVKVTTDEGSAMLQQELTEMTLCMLGSWKYLIPFICTNS